MTTPSLVNIPAGYKSLKMYSQLPTDGVGDFDVARTDSPDGCATRVNSAGLIESVLSNVPRLDYSDSSCPVWLAEPSTTNLLTYSEDFTDASWLKANTGTGVVPVVTSNYAISPDGTQNADRVQLDCGGGLFADRSILRQSETTTTNPYTLSYYVKSNAGAGTQTIATHFNGANVTNVVVTEDEWVRVEYTGNGAGALAFYGLELRGTITDNTADILVWGAMLEQKSYPTSYVKTTGATATRGADVIDGAGDVNTFNISEGTFFVEINALANSGTFRGITIHNASLTDRIRVYLSNVDNQIRLFINENGVLNAYTINLINALDYSKFLVSYNNGLYKVFLNGTLVNSFTLLGFANVFSELSLHNGGGTENFYGKVKQIQVYKSALTDLQIESLTGFSSFSLMAEYLNYTIY